MQNHKNIIPEMMADNQAYSNRLTTIFEMIDELKLSLGDTTWAGEIGSTLSSIVQVHDGTLEGLRQVDWSSIQADVDTLRHDLSEVKSTGEIDVKSIDTELDLLHETLRTLRGEMAQSIRAEVERLQHERAGRLPASSRLAAGPARASTLPMPATSGITFDTVIQGHIHESPTSIRDLLERLTRVETSLRVETETRITESAAINEKMTDLVAQVKDLKDGYTTLRETVAASGGVSVLATNLRDEDDCANKVRSSLPATAVKNSSAASVTSEGLALASVEMKDLLIPSFRIKTSSSRRFFEIRSAKSISQA